MQGIQRVMQRINELEQRLGANTDRPDTRADSFAKTLAWEQQALGANVGSGDQSIVGMVRAAALQQGVDPQLALAVAKAESGLRPQAVSPAGAQGVMQLMPETAKDLGVSNPFDARQNIEGGVKYLKTMLDCFQGDPQQAIAAYNAGPQAVRQYGGVPPYAETQEYVKRVIGMTQE